MLSLSPLQVIRRSIPYFLSLSGMVNELNLPHCSILYFQEDWLCQIWNFIIGRSNLRLLVDPQSKVSWRVIEADKVKPHRLQDILFPGTGNKNDKYEFGLVVANSVRIWKRDFQIL